MRAVRHRLLSICSLLAGHVAAQQPVPTWISTADLGCFTPPGVLAAVGLAGTDLGVAFPLGDRVAFLFGDSWTPDRRDQDADSVAFTPRALPPAGLPALTWLTREGGRFHGLAPKGLQLGGMNVPVEGIVVGDRVHVFFSDGWDPRRGRHSHSVCATARGVELHRLEVAHRAPTDRFVNVSIVRDGDTCWIFGTGDYRKSDVFLARVASRDLADREAWRYWPDFTADESKAQPIVTGAAFGELSVRRVPGSELWWMTMNAPAPRGVHLRIAAAPAGPWSERAVIFDPGRDRGYGHFMHQKSSVVGFDDGVSEAGREEEWGGEYGPYLVPEWCATPAKGVVDLVYTLSTWNPYAVRLLRSRVVLPGIEWQEPAATSPPIVAARPPRNLGFANGSLEGWRQEGDRFATARRDDGSWFVCTYVAPGGDAVKGRIWQEFTVPPAAKELRGFVWGGSETVELWRGDERVRCTRGRRTNDRETPLRWNLEALRGARVRLQIADESVAPWGFVSVRGLDLVE